MRRIIITFLLIGILLASHGSTYSRLYAQVEDPEVEAILAQMSAEERVGQLFLVTFYGSDVGLDSEIAALISRYQIGGVVLLSKNNNFTDESDILSQIYQLTTQLQTLTEEQLQSATTEPLGSPLRPGPYVPLFIGLEFGGSSGYAYLPEGMTPLPSNMAIGATWDPAFAEATGQVVGQELSALGINLLLGPSADVVEVPHPGTSGDMGVQVFGGEPYWVSQMTAAYVRGVHTGSSGRMAVVPGHFPGYGSADRLATVEVPTVRRSLFELVQFDLRPFFAVTGNTIDPLDEADGLMTAHIRYQGFQGDNLRFTTRPISLDANALQELVRLDPIARWRTAGGLFITDALGVRGVRRMYDTEGTVFPNRPIALAAFLAGNDILYLDDFGNNPPVDQTNTVIDTIEFFVQRYNTDTDFEARVDGAVRRILRKKLDLYGNFNLNVVLPPSSGLETIGQQREVTFSVARSALTLLQPDRVDELNPPQEGDRIVVFTDTRLVNLCDDCVASPLIDVGALQSTILSLYGPQASGQVSVADIRSFSFDQLASYLEYGPPEATDETSTPQPDLLGIALDTADWVVFVMLDVDTTSAPSSDVVKRFLAESPVSSDTQVIVMAMGAPYYLDSTEISKLAAYYALYGYTGPFVDVAARALFLQVPLNGSSPVSVSGLGYNILEVTSPDPDQVIALSYSIEQQEGSDGEEAEDTIQTPTETPASTPLATTEEPAAEGPIVCLGDKLHLSTSVILDWNGNYVPNGTPVEFVFSYDTEGLRDTRFVETTTIDGIGRISRELNRSGDLEIVVRSGDATNSTGLGLAITERCGRVEPLPPDIRVTATPTATEESPTPTTGPLPTPTLSPTPLPPPPPVVSFSDLFLSMFGLIGIGLVVFFAGLRGNDVNYSLLLALPTFVFGMVGYNYYALLLPGALRWRSVFGDVWSAGIATWIGALVGLGLVHIGLLAWKRWMGSPTLLKGQPRREERREYGDEE